MFQSVLTYIYRRVYRQEKKHTNFVHRLILNIVHSLEPSELLFDISMNISALWQLRNNQWLSTDLLHQGLNMLRDLHG